MKEISKKSTQKNQRKKKKLKLSVNKEIRDIAPSLGTDSWDR